MYIVHILCSNQDWLLKQFMSIDSVWTVWKSRSRAGRASRSDKTRNCKTVMARKTCNSPDIIPDSAASRVWSWWEESCGDSVWQKVDCQDGCYLRKLSWRKRLFINVLRVWARTNPKVGFNDFSWERESQWEDSNCDKLANQRRGWRTLPGP